MSKIPNPYGDDRQLVCLNEGNAEVLSDFDEFIELSEEMAEAEGSCETYFMDIETFKKHAHKLYMEEIAPARPVIKAKLTLR